MSDASYDLHTHTVFSDGTLTPYELLERAASLGLAGVGITDHDTIAALPEADAIAPKFGLDVVHGVEVSTTWQKKDVHILAYTAFPPDGRLTTFLADMAADRERRFQRMLAILDEHGIVLDEAAIRAKAGKGTIGRPHVAQAIVDAGYAPNFQVAFQKYLVRGKPAFVPRQKITPVEAVRLIRDCGAVPVLAHPGLVRDDAIIDELIPAGLLGIEAGHSDHTPQQVQHYRSLAEHHGLLCTSGSDFHGRKGRNELGRHRTSRETVEQLRALLAT